MPENRRRDEDVPLPADLPLPAAELRASLLEWFAGHARRMPARETHDPWRLLVLEVMSQQTQIERAAPASERFCDLFPTPAALASAAPADAVRAWSGLGYNRRAVALWRAAVAIVDRHAGAVPSDVVELLALPGIGPYTAHAVAAHAFGVPTAPVDVNVARVAGRVAGTAERTEVQATADALLDPADPSRSIHALMDLSAAVCRRRAPDCSACPLAFGCAWARSGVDGAATAGGTPLAKRGSDPPPAVRPLAFPSTRRWLRGALLRELVAAPPAAWSDFEGRSVGSHPPHAVREALAGLGAEGLVELDEAGRARLPERSSVDRER